MFSTSKSLILASASPRRKRFLTDLGLDFLCCPADIDETPQTDESPAAFSLRMSGDKARAIAEQYPDSYVIGSDTVVTIDNRILGKPVDPDQALSMLKTLQGHTHQVITGLSLVCLRDNCSSHLHRITKVSFSTFADQILRAYIKTGDPMDKAGAYGIQARGSFLVREIKGSCSNVIGLPVNDCVALLLEHGVICAV